MNPSPPIIAFTNPNDIKHHHLVHAMLITITDGIPGKFDIKHLGVKPAP